MTTITSKVAAATLAAAALAGPLAAAAQARPAVAATIATEQRAAPVSRYGGVIAWSDYSDGAFHLMLDQGGKITPAPVPSSPTPFDVDLGTNRAGHLVAVYSHSGALHELDIAAGTSKQLHPGVSGRLSHPTMSAARYAFVARRQGRDVLYLRTVDHGTRAMFTAGTSSQSSITSPRLSDKRLAYVTSGPARYGRLENLRVQTLSARRSKVVYSARSGSLNFASIVGPGFDTSGTHLYWARRNLGSGAGNRYIRLTVSSGRLAYAQGTNRLYSTSWADNADGFASVIAGSNDDPSAPGSPTTVVLTGPLAFTAGP